MKQFFLLLFLTSILTSNAQSDKASTNASTTGLLTVSTSTSQVWGGYQPNNIVAIWVEDSSGKFVKTLMVYAEVRLNYLTHFMTSADNNRVDAISGATQTTFGVLNCTWNGTDVTGVNVADGSYSIKMELTDDDLTGNYSSFSFVKGVSPQTLNPADVPSFSKTTIKWVPTNTAIDDLKFGNLYSVYPNPTKSSVFVSGTDIKEIELCTLSGKRIFITSEQSVNLGMLPKGIYLAKVKTSKGTVIKKITKE